MGRPPGSKNKAKNDVPGIEVGVDGQPVVVDTLAEPVDSVVAVPECVADQVCLSPDPLPLPIDDSPAPVAEPPKVKSKPKPIVEPSEEYEYFGHIMRNR